ncbi:hypothetical protein J6590_045815 [Homalodisca vitripennis]|nr:hypothetical protein J6590_045815 [Homalodisca vitripennis]
MCSSALTIGGRSESTQARSCLIQRIAAGHIKVAWPIQFRDRGTCGRVDMQHVSSPLGISDYSYVSVICLGG